MSGSKNAYCRRSSIHQQKTWGDKSERQLIENRYSPYVPRVFVGLAVITRQSNKTTHPRRGALFLA